MEEARTSDAEAPISLCLSGGGFRATFFHLGVVRFLRDAGILPRVKSIYSVSGGSILAAHLALHWTDYCDQRSDEPFHRRSTELIKFAQRNIRGRILRRFLLLGWSVPFFRRSQQLVAEYEQLFRGAELQHLPYRPRLTILTTSMTTGDCCSFTRETYNVLTDRARPLPAPNMRLAFAVAASSAFPPLFPPVVLTREMVGATEKEFPLDGHHLTDGGVFDNVGLHAFRRDHSSAPNDASLLLVSDASGPFDWRLTSRFRFVGSRAERWTAIMMWRIAQLERTLGTDMPTVPLSIEEVVSTKTGSSGQVKFDPQDEAVQRMVKSVRTDLDHFSLDLIRVLAGHGYEVAWNQFMQLGYLRHIGAPPDRSKAWKPWDPAPPGWPRYELILMIREAIAAENPLHDLVSAWHDYERNTKIALGQVPPAPAAPSGAEQRDRTDRMRLLIKIASGRRWWLFDPGDWVSWILGAVILGIVFMLWFIVHAV
jgi:predicted acylesterase/phospholipase RssA